ncbi:MAG: hypothetical protein AB7V58_03195 [Solirubrobacterales bacterium]
MKRLLALGATLTVLVTAIFAATATADKPTTVRAGNLVLTLNGGFKPKALPKRRFAPIGLTAAGKVRTADGSHPPALRRFVLDTDRNGAIDVRGYPTCRSGMLQSRDSSDALRVCRRALIGRGHTDVEIAFPEQRPIPAHSRLLVFNGGVRGGTTTLYVHAYITVPTPAAIVTTVKVRKHRSGRYGLRSVATIPKIAGGAGSVTSFFLHIRKVFRRGGRKVSVLTARCRDGKLQARGEAHFSDGSTVRAEIVRRCRPK